MQEELFDPQSNGKASMQGCRQAEAEEAAGAPLFFAEWQLLSDD